jgi:hypothetical protein
MLLTVPMPFKISILFPCDVSCCRNQTTLVPHSFSTSFEQTTLVHKGFDEVRRLGLMRETEGLVRAAATQETGMLVVDSVVPAGPAHGALETGDVLVRLEGQVSLATFCVVEVRKYA